jgi:hypothetical protein
MEFIIVNIIENLVNLRNMKGYPRVS